MNLTRRQLLGSAVAGGAMLSGFDTPLVAEEARKQDRQVLFVWLDGGMSQLESWDPKPNSPFGGPFRSIQTSAPGIRISELLPKTAKWMHHMAIVRSLCTQDNSHSAGVDRIQRGDPKNRGVVYPFLGSAVVKLLGADKNTFPPYVWIKPGNGGFLPKDGGFLGPRFGALALGDGKAPDGLLRPAALLEEDDIARNDLRRLIDLEYARERTPAAVEANAHVYAMAEQLQKHRNLFDESTFSPKDVERYGKHDLGRHLLMGRRMIEHGVTFVKVTSYGWDTHGDNFNGHLSLVGKLDQGFSALMEDLHERRMLDRVLVVVMSEFGRTPRINGHLGRDHWPEAWSLACAGRGLKKGVAVGKTNEQGTWVSDEAHDIGHLFHTWFHALGIDTSKVEYNNNGQPLPVAHEECKPIAELLA